MKMTYKEQLETREWKLRRYYIFDLRGHNCMNCNSDKKLNIHHLKYTGMAWEAPDEDLICLCETCHKKVHDINNEFTNDICRQLIKKFDTLCEIREKIHTDFINYVEIGKEYLRKDLNVVLKQLCKKYEVDLGIKLNHFDGTYCETLNISLYFNKIKIDKTSKIIITILE